MKGGKSTKNNYEWKSKQKKNLQKTKRTLDKPGKEGMELEFEKDKHKQIFG